MHGETVKLKEKQYFIRLHFQKNKNKVFFLVGRKCSIFTLYFSKCSSHEAKVQQTT